MFMLAAFDFHKAPEMNETATMKTGNNFRQIISFSNRPETPNDFSFAKGE